MQLAAQYGPWGAFLMFSDPVDFGERMLASAAGFLTSEQPAGPWQVAS